MSFEKINGVVINSWDIDLKTKGVNVFTREYGMIPLYAQGVNTLVSKNRYSIQTMSISEFEIFRARKKDSMSKLKTGYLVNDNLNIARNFNNYILSTIAVDIMTSLFEVSQFTRKQMQRIYDNFILLLNSLNSNNKAFNSYIFFLVSLIPFTGYKWTVDKCYRCNVLRKKLMSRFDYVGKGLVCFYCLNQNENIQPDNFINLILDLKKYKFADIIKREYRSQDLVVLHNVLINFFRDEVGTYPKGFEVLKENAACVIPNIIVEEYL